MLIDDLKDLHKQATEERSHHYTGHLVLRAIAEIERLELENWQLKSSLGYAVPDHVPDGPFKCGLCEARRKEFHQLTNLTGLVKEKGGDIGARIDRLEGAVHELNPGWMP
jgi:hypothetical protein